MSVQIFGRLSIQSTASAFKKNQILERCCHVCTNRRCVCFGIDAVDREPLREADLPFRQAHKIVARMVQTAVKANKGSDDLTLEMLQASAQEVLGHPLDFSEEQFALALDPEHFVAVRGVAGGVAPVATAQVLDDLAWRLHADEEWLQGAQQRLDQAEIARQAECAKLTGAH